jgi:hypothetical protein
LRPISPDFSRSGADNAAGSDDQQVADDEVTLCYQRGEYVERRTPRAPGVYDR